MSASYDYEDGLRDHCVDDPLWAADEIERLRAENARSLKEAKPTARRIGEAHREIERLRAEVATLMDGMELAWGLIANGRAWDAAHQDDWDAAEARFRDDHWHPALRRNVSADEVARARALISWIDGACTDQRPHADIAAAITRWKDEQC